MMLLGVVGVFLPFLQGVIFLIIGLVILSFEFSSIDERMIKYLEKYPQANSVYAKMRKFLEKYLG